MVLLIFCWSRTTGPLVISAGHRPPDHWLFLLVTDHRTIGYFCWSRTTGPLVISAGHRPQDHWLFLLVTDHRTIGYFDDCHPRNDQPLSWVSTGDLTTHCIAIWDSSRPLFRHIDHEFHLIVPRACLAKFSLKQCAQKRPKTTSFHLISDIIIQESVISHSWKKHKKPRTKPDFTASYLHISICIFPEENSLPSQC